MTNTRKTVVKLLMNYHMIKKASVYSSTTIDFKTCTENISAKMETDIRPDFFVDFFANFEKTDKKQCSF